MEFPDGLEMGRSLNKTLPLGKYEYFLELYNRWNSHQDISSIKHLFSLPRFKNNVTIFTSFQDQVSIFGSYFGRIPKMAIQCMRVYN